MFIYPYLLFKYMNFGKIKDDVFNIFKKREYQILFFILIFAAVLRLFVYFKTLGQPVWWD